MSRGVPRGETRMLAPTLELGLRRDGGDAETGMGVDLGGALRYRTRRWATAHHRYPSLNRRLPTDSGARTYLWAETRARESVWG